MEFQENPTVLDGYKFNAGNIIMGMKGSSQIKFDIEAAGRDIDRKIQDKMYD